MDFYYTYLEGRITIPEKPKYYQKGDGPNHASVGSVPVRADTEDRETSCRLRMSALSTPSSLFTGVTSATRPETVFDNYAPVFNEEMYFKISLDKNEADPKFYEELKNNLKSKSEITAYVWLDLQNGQFENIGYVNCSLSELNGQLAEEKSFYDFELKKAVKHYCRVAGLRKRVVSSMIDNSNTHLNLSFYLMPDYKPDKLKRRRAD